MITRSLFFVVLFFPFLGQSQTWPIHTEAESFTAQVSGTTTLCSEGGQCVSYLPQYSWLEYQITLPKDSIYKLSVRIAGSAGEVDIFDSAWNRLGCVYFARTTSDQTYTTASTYLYLKAGTRRVRLQFCSQMCSLNWFEVTPSHGLFAANYFESDWQFTTPTYSTVAWKACRADSVNSAYLRTSDNSRSWIKQTARPSSLLLSNEYPRAGKSCARFELSKSDSSTPPYLRAEIYTGPCPQNEMWFGFSTMSPIWVATDALAHIIWQLHGSDDPAQNGHPAEAKSPNIAIRIEHDSVYLKIVWCAALYSSDVTKDGEITYNLGKYQLGVWDDWAVHVKFAYDNTGVLELWRNGVQKVSRLNAPNAYNDNYPSYLKFGIYKYGWTAPWFDYTPYDTVVIYYDNIKVGGQYSDRTEIDPAQ